MSPLNAAISGVSINSSMADPTNPEAQSEELDLEQLEGVAGGILAQANQQPQIQIAKPRKGQVNKSKTNTHSV